MKSIIFLCVAFLVFSCGKQNTKPEEKITDSIDFVKKDSILSVKEKSHLQIDYMEELPEEAAGCGCYFSDSKENVNKINRFLYADNIDKIGYVKINGRLEKFVYKDLDSTLEKKHSVFENKNYTGEIKTKIIPLKSYKLEGNEVWFYEGELIIKDKKGNILKKKIYGQCGC